MEEDCQNYHHFMFRVNNNVDILSIFLGYKWLFLIIPICFTAVQMRKSIFTKKSQLKIISFQNFKLCCQIHT